MVVVYKFIARVVSVTVISEVCSERSYVVWVSLRAGVETCLSPMWCGSASEQGWKPALVLCGVGQPPSRGGNLP